MAADDVVDAVAVEACGLAGALHAWAARVENGTLGSPRIASADSSVNPAGASDPPEPSLPALFGSLSASAPIARADGFVAFALPGSSGAAEGIVAITRSPVIEDAELDLELVALATVAGLALEGTRQRARIDAVSHARETLLSCVSHDLRNPLNTFAMSAGLLRDDLERDDVDTARGISLIARMERATSRMQGLIEDLVEASRIDARKIDFAVREEGAAQLVRDAVLAATKVAPEKGAAVVCDSLDEDARVMTDRARTLQLLSKIVAFEAKSTGDSGTIRIGVARQGDSVVFTARAIGPGGSALSAPEEGRGGLALLIARGLVEAQRGSFRVETGDGLAVAFTLPTAK